MDDNKLIEFLRKILPIVEEELATGITNVFEFSQDDNDIKLNIEKYQTISLNKYYTEGNVSKKILIKLANLNSNLCVNINYFQILKFF